MNSLHSLSHHPSSTKRVQRSLEVVKDDSVTEALEHKPHLKNALSLLRMVEVSSELIFLKGLRVCHPRLRPTVGRPAKPGHATRGPMVYARRAITGVTTVLWGCAAPEWGWLPMETTSRRGASVPGTIRTRNKTVASITKRACDQCKFRKFRKFQASSISSAPLHPPPPFAKYRAHLHSLHIPSSKIATWATQ
jgi:hypothetical protein